MPRYMLTAEVTISVTCYVQAPTEADAVKCAEEYPMGSIVDASDGDPDCWHAEELDGSVANIRVEPGSADGQ